MGVLESQEFATSTSAKRPSSSPTSPSRSRVDDDEQPLTSDHASPLPPLSRQHPPIEEWQKFVFHASRQSSDASNTQGQPWSTMAAIVRNVDEQKIKHYKEDIDSILVFVRGLFVCTTDTNPILSVQAGLFSTVMTSFLVESYKNLSEDPKDIEIVLLRQIASQTHSYTLTAGSLNSTATPFTQNAPQFRPSANSIAVNILWFASLSLSLIGASLAILVKQWLREYLAGEYTSPQAHLRIRHFRNPGLRHWKVFEIAAIVPLLLQLCLALFLIGLCFFTAEVHSTIGHVTLPLVAGWGFLVMSATLAPVFSPRCPYKTSLLLSAMAFLRKKLARAIRWAVQDDIPLDQLSKEAPIPGAWSYRHLAYEEKNAVRTDESDIDILIAVDAIQADDHLLRIMWDALRQTHLDAASLVQFVQKIINNRNPSPAGMEDDRSLPSMYHDLSGLPQPTIGSIMLMTADILSGHLKRAVTDTLRPLAWVNECVCILLSDTDIPMPEAVNDTLSRILADPTQYKPLFEVMTQKTPNADLATFSRVLHRLRGAFALVEDERLMQTFITLVQKYFCIDHPGIFHSLTDIARDHPNFTAGHSNIVADFLIYRTRQRTSNPYDALGIDVVLNFQVILELLDISDGSWRPSVVELVQHFLLAVPGLLVLCPFAVGLCTRLNDMLDLSQETVDSMLKVKPEAQQLIIDAIITCDGSGEWLYCSIRDDVYKFTAHIFFIRTSTDDQ